MSSALLRRVVRPHVQRRWKHLITSPPALRAAIDGGGGGGGGGGSKRGLVCNAAVNADHRTQIAVSDCLERVFGPEASSQCDFAVIFYEGHEGGQVQKALDAYVKGRPDSPPVFGCSLNDGWKRHQLQQEQKLREQEALYRKQMKMRAQEREEGRASDQPSSSSSSPSPLGSSTATSPDFPADMLPTSAYVAAESDESDTDDSEEDRDDTEEAEADNYTECEHRLLTGFDENIIEILGGADAVIDALAEATRDRVSYTRSGPGLISRRKARRNQRRKKIMRRNYEKQGMSPRIVTVLGLGFEGRAEAIPAVANYGAFPHLGGGENIARLFSLPAEERPHFLLLARKNAAFGLERSLERIARLLPGGSRLAGVSSGGRETLVSSFPAGQSPVVGICLAGNISVKEQAELASKTLGAFGVGGVVVAGGACEELFVPRKPPPPPPPALISVDDTKTATDAASPASTTSGPAAPIDRAPKGEEAEGVGVTSQAGAERGGRREGETASAAAALEGIDGSAVCGAGAEKSSRSRAETRAPPPRSSVPSQLCVFKVDDFVYPGMRRRYNIFEPRYRALVKRCLRDREPLLLLPLSLEGNAVGTAAYVSGLFNVHEDGRCEIEITGYARCHVKAMWMKGESFGLHEAVVEYFEDEERAAADNDHPQGRKEAEKAVGDTLSTDDGSGQAGRLCAGASPATREGEDERKGEGQGQGAGEKSCGEREEEEEEEEEEQKRSNVENLQIEISAVLHREIFRTQQMGFSPMWPELKREDVSNISGYEAADGAGGGRGLSLDRLDPEAFSFWAAQHISADADAKLRWLSCRSTEERLADISRHVRLANMQANTGSTQGSREIVARVLQALNAKPRGGDGGDKE